tara:strand:- start:15347 stop:16810 length:1464 start_codon:yes stop_codon:yes gene_type:complete
MGKKNKVDGRQVLQEFIKRFGDVEGIDLPEGESERTFRWREDLFDKQLDLIDDPAKQKAALCSRRAGKTYTCCFYMLEVAHKFPDSLIPYIALTRSVAKRLMWGALKRANNRYQVGMKFNNNELIATLKNGSQISLNGANDEADIDKLRGSAYPLVVIDEAASYGPFLPELVEDVLEPALIDYSGTLLMTGTPNARCHGYFFDATTKEDSGFSTHKWTIRQNPYIPHAGDYLDKKLVQKGWSQDNPVYLREWCGKWIRSDDSLVYKYSDLNRIAVPPTGLDYVLGVDLGFTDATAFVIWGFTQDKAEAYLVEGFKQTRLITSEIAEIIEELNRTYGFISMVADCGGLGKSMVEEMRRRFGLPLKAAEKRSKFSYIELFNDGLRTERIKVIDGCSIFDEWDLLQWDENRNKEDARFENHLADAALYGWRECRHFLYEPPLEAASEGSTRWYDELEDKIWEQKRRSIEGDNRPMAIRDSSVLKDMMGFN